MRLLTLLFLGTALCAAPHALAQQAPGGEAIMPEFVGKYDHTKPYPAYTAPRLAIGQPDLQAVWTNASLTKEQRPANAKGLTWTEEEVAKMEGAVVQEIKDGNKRTDPNAPTEDKESYKNIRPEFAAAGGAVGGYNRGWLDPGDLVMRVNGEPRTSVLTTPDGRQPQRKPGAPIEREERPAFLQLLGDSPTPRGGMYDNPESRGSERCIVSFGRNGPPPMFSNGFYNNNYQIVQSPDHVVIEIEMIHDVRIVRLNAKHRTDGLRPYFGDSIGWWEGDTLVVETTNLPQNQAYAGAWKNLKVTERFKRVAADRLLYQFTVEDPTMWDKPWGGEYEFRPLDTQRLFEYACHEGNYAMHGILAGARVEEQRKAAAAAAAAKAAPAQAKGKSATPTKN